MPGSTCGRRTSRGTCACSRASCAWRGGWMRRSSRARCARSRRSPHGRHHGDGGMTVLVEHAPYLAVYLAAMIEGEAVFAMASVLVAAGKLNALSVVVSGALGAATGDQIYFYAFRGAFRRFARIAARAEQMPPGRLAHVRAIVERHQTLAAFALRFID